MNVLFIGDIIARPGRKVLRELLPSVKTAYHIDLTIANVENSAGGFGLTTAIAEELLEMGVDVMTSGNHIWDKKEILEYIKTKPQLLRPANFPPGCPGTGLWLEKTALGDRVAVINLQGRVYMPSIDCPFRAADELLKEIGSRTKIILVDFHAEATSEKICLGRYLDGRVSAVLGTHTHVQTADEQILDQGTAYITDVGMSGPHDSVIGVDYQSSLQRFLLQIPRKYDSAQGKSKLNAVIVDIEAESGRARGIRRLSLDESWRP